MALALAVLLVPAVPGGGVVAPQQAEAADASDVSAWDGNVASAFADGSGTEVDPWQIANGAQLAYLAKQVNDGTDFSKGKYFKLTADINLNSKAWTPIGTTDTGEGGTYKDATIKSKTFQGTFDGDGHVITGLSVEGGSTSEQYHAYGLFATLGPNAVLQNFTVAGTVKVTAKNHGNAGGVVGFASNYGTENATTAIRNVGSSVAVDAGSGVNRVGGIVGYAAIALADGTITVDACYNKGAITAAWKLAGSGGGIGGLVGHVQGQSLSGVAHKITFTITNSYNAGSVTSSASSVNRSVLGGIVGNCGQNNVALSISNCFNAGAVTLSYHNNTTQTNTWFPGAILGATTNTTYTAKDNHFLQGCYNNTWKNPTSHQYDTGQVGGKLWNSSKQWAADETGTFTAANGLSAATMGSAFAEGGQSATVSVNGAAASSVEIPSLSWEVKKATHTVTWNDADGTQLDQTKDVEDGAIVSYASATPTKAADAQYTYAFAGWTPDPAATKITADTTFTAIYTRTVRSYTVTWKNADGTVLKTEQLAYGSTPSYAGDTPTKQGDDAHSYVFAGWQDADGKAPAQVTGDATYTATFTEKTNQYAVQYVDYDGTVLQSTTVDYGSATPAHSGTPTRASDAQHDYAFAGWSPSVADTVTGPATYIAVYTSTAREYAVTWKDEDGTVLRTDQVAYGEVPSYGADNPAKAADDEGAWSFAGWSPAVASVTGEATYTATYQRVGVKTTFKVPDSSFGSYTVNGTAITADADRWQQAGASYSLVATPTASGQFIGWYNGSGKCLSREAAVSLSFDSEGIQVEARFAKLGTVFSVNGTGKVFDTWGDAFAYAQEVGQKVITLVADYTLTEHITIPSGYTLVVPFDEAGTLYTTTPSVAHEDLGTASAYRTLTVASTGSIDVQGALSIGGNYYVPGGSESGRITGPYGLIKTEEDASITVEDDGSLYAWGYVIGKGSVDVKSGGTTYEWFQITDFRGGNASLTSIVQDGTVPSGQKAFPFSQYYVQNVECPIVFEKGASGKAASALYYYSAVQQLLTFDMVGEGDSGFFGISSGTLTRDYDESADRTVYTVNGDAQANGISFMGMSSSAFVVPLTSTTAVDVATGSLTAKQNLAFLPGSKVTVAKGAELDVASGASVFVYDSADWAGKGYVYHGSNVDFVALPYVPDRAKTFGAGDLVDAAIDVNGTVNVEGAVYTTKGDASGGAAITSSEGTGEWVQTNIAPWDEENSCFTTTETYQYTQSGNVATKSAVTVEPAQLQDADGSHWPTAVAAAGDTVSYEDGKWSDPCTLAFDANGGTGETASVTFDKADASVTLPESGFRRPGYEFLGWASTASDEDPDDPEEPSAARSEVSLLNGEGAHGAVGGDALESSILYYARWKELEEGYLDVSQYKHGTDDAAKWEAPEPADAEAAETAGLFAGWYKSKDAADGTGDYAGKPLSERVYDGATGAAYAKFVPWDVLKVGVQFAANTTTGSASTDMRLLTTVDGLDYQKVGFMVKRQGEEGFAEKSTTTVFKTVTELKGGKSVATDASKNANFAAGTSRWYAPFTYTGIPSSAYSTSMSVCPFWVTADDTTVYGFGAGASGYKADAANDASARARTFVISDLIDAAASQASGGTAAKRG